MSGPEASPTYPAAVREAEESRLASRRAAVPGLDGRSPGVEGALGFALSGGGIRSATFALGVFQGLARHGLLRHVDYLSTVSGGGYFGAFLGRLFTRDLGPPSGQDAVRTPVEEVLLGERHPEILRALRENGRYLSPNGAGDLLLGGAVLFRNWVALQVVIGTALVTACLLVVAPDETARLTFPDVRAATVDAVGWLYPEGVPPAARSPWALIPVALVPLAVVPIGVAYFLSRTGAAVFAAAAVAYSAGLVFASSASPGPFQTVLLAPLVPLGAVLWWLPARWLAGGGMFTPLTLDQGADRRHRLSLWFKWALFGTGVLLVATAVDTAGGWLRGVLRGDSESRMWAGGAVPVLLAAAASARRVVVAFSGGNAGWRPRVPLRLAAGAAAVTIALVLLVGASAAAHALVHSPVDDPFRPLFALSGGTFVCLLMGRSAAFLTRSSHHPLYAARLARAWLGASNPARRSADKAALTKAVPGDDVDLPVYFGAGGPPGAAAVAPLHLVNVTINETVDGRSQVQQQDRRGTGMALGPAGISVGVRHHAVFPGEWGRDLAPCGVPDGGHRVFARGVVAVERLTLGQWVAVSGAAFSTGLGSRTSLGLSLLAGLANVRLGYWWDPGKVGTRTRAEGMFPVQHYLAGELLARFPGTAHRRWYLSDGGHFENMGAYELVRRRLRRMVVVDAEADPDYTFEGLANLVRKSRVDFGAEITFLDDQGLDESVAEGVRPLFGTLAQLRRGRWTEGGDTRAARRPTLEAADRTGLSRACAALARVRYRDGGPTDSGWLLYIKPALVGTEPADVTQYHASHPAFPQETTADQFFDEAQWEGYRALGEHIARVLFAEVRLNAQADGPAESPRRLVTGIGRPPPPAPPSSGPRQAQGLAEPAPVASPTPTVVRGPG